MCVYNDMPSYKNSGLILPLGPQSLKYSLFGPLQKKFDDFCYDKKQKRKKKKDKEEKEKWCNVLLSAVKQRHRAKEWRTTAMLCQHSHGVITRGWHWKAGNKGNSVTAISQNVPKLCEETYKGSMFLMWEGKVVGYKAGNSVWARSFGAT